MGEAKNILVDLGKLVNLYTGLGQVSLNFGAELAALQDPRLNFTFLTPPDYIGKFGDAVQYEPLSYRRRYLPALAPRYHLWHATHADSAYMPGDTRTPYLLTIHDLNFMHEKGPRKAALRLRRLQKKVKRADSIVFISNYTRQFAASHLDLAGKPQEVIYNGIKPPPLEIAKKPPYLDDTTPFLFAMGVIKPKKNFHVLVDLIKHLPPYRLILAGDTSDPYAGDIMRAAEKAGVKERIIMTGPIGEAEKSYFYQHCAAFLFPSIAEGFGLPVAEALSFGKPVFTVNSTSLGEIGGDQVYFWDNFEGGEMAALFKKRLPEFEDPKKIRGRKKHAAQYSWSKCAAQYLELYRSLLS